MHSTDILEQFPEIGTPVEDLDRLGLRERLVGPYRVIYRFTGTECRIGAVVRVERDLSRAITPDDFD